MVDITLLTLRIKKAYFFCDNTYEFITYSHMGNRSSFLDAAEKGDLERLQRQIGRCVSINATDDEGLSAIIIAAAEGHIEVVKFLLAKGARVHDCDNVSEFYYLA